MSIHVVKISNIKSISRPEVANEVICSLALQSGCTSRHRHAPNLSAESVGRHASDMAKPPKPCLTEFLGYGRLIAAPPTPTYFRVRDSVLPANAKQRPQARHVENFQAVQLGIQRTPRFAAIAQGRNDRRVEDLHFGSDGNVVAFP